MYLELQGIPTEKDLQTYPSVHLTSPHEWDPSITKTFNLIPILMNLVIMSIDHCPFMTY